MQSQKVLLYTKRTLLIVSLCVAVAAVIFMCIPGSYISYHVPDPSVADFYIQKNHNYFSALLFAGNPLPTWAALCTVLWLVAGVARTAAEFSGAYHKLPFVVLPIAIFALLSVLFASLHQNNSALSEAIRILILIAVVLQTAALLPIHIWQMVQDRRKNKPDSKRDEA